MRRIRLIVCIAALAVGVFATLAFARIKHFQGPIDQGGKIEFDAKFRHGKPRKAGDFSLGYMTLRCAQGVEVEVRFVPDGFVRVKRRQFHYEFARGRRATARVKGEFNPQGNEAQGTFTADHLKIRPARRCTTNGPREWTAERGR
jgi:hypothetical protein